jgi:hypothetical protein
VANGKVSLDAREQVPAGRVRRPGGGRRPLAEADPGMAAALEKLITDASRGDPMSPLVWTTHSAAHLAGELAAQGHPCSDSTVLRTLKRMGYTPQSNSRAQEGRRHPDRDGRFRRIAAAAREFTAAGQPVISVDAKKKEQVGNFGHSAVVRDHDFAGRGEPHAIPYGIYDERANAGVRERRHRREHRRPGHRVDPPLAQHGRQGRLPRRGWTRTPAPRARRSANSG